MSPWKILGFGSEKPGSSVAGETETVRRIVNELEAMDPEHARYLAAFAYILGRVAHADDGISDEETRKMEQIVAGDGNLSQEQAILVVQIAKSQNRLAGGTEDFLVTREFRRIATKEQCKALLDCLFAVSAADESISGIEEQSVREIASELGLTRDDYITIRSAYSRHREVMKKRPDSS